ncbi:hypothetical protein [Streptomyces sp. NPDC098101]|uniref:hypothetical protein n=1 Tax=Streptomyces sp. NPDC098101 TaxID=3366096 RepID=UPI003800A346
MDGHRTVVMAVVPDEDPAREPVVCFDPNGGHQHVPYPVMRWFMDRVDEEDLPAVLEAAFGRRPDGTTIL